MTDNYSLCIKVCIGDSVDLWSIQNLQGDWFSRKEYYSSVDCLRLFSEVMGLTCKRALSWWYFACCLTQMACEYLSMEVMERWITSESWVLTSINIKWGFLRRFWGGLCTRHPDRGCINTNDTLCGGVWFYLDFVVDLSKNLWMCSKKKKSHPLCSFQLASCCATPAWIQTRPPRSCGKWLYAAASTSPSPEMSFSTYTKSPRTSLTPWKGQRSARLSIFAHPNNLL